MSDDDDTYVMGRRPSDRDLQPGARVDYVHADCLHGTHRRSAVFVRDDGDTVHLAANGEIFDVARGLLLLPVTWKPSP